MPLLHANHRVLHGGRMMESGRQPLGILEYGFESVHVIVDFGSDGLEKQ